MSNVTMGQCVNNDEWNQAADKAKEAAASASEMATHAASAVGVLAGQAACEAGRKADDVAARVGVGLQSLGDRISREGPQAGVFANASQAVGRTVRESGEYVENAKLSGMTDDLAVLIRRNPIPAVLIALGLGWFVGRKLGV